AAPLPPEIAACLEVVDERGGAEMRIVGANAVDQRPEFAGVGRALAPAGEERAAVGKRQREAQIEADQGTGRHLVSQPVEDLRPGPAVTAPDEARCIAPELANRHGNAAVPLARGPGPIDRGEVAEALSHAPAAACSSKRCVPSPGA